MSSVRFGRRLALLGSLGLLAGWEPYRVNIYVVNATGETVHGRLVTPQRRGDDWFEVKAGETGPVGACLHHGLCSPSAGWLPDDFEGIELKLADGTVITVSRERFEREAVRSRGWQYRFDGS